MVKKVILLIGVFSIICLILFAQEAMLIDDQGNVGIGIEDPQEKLEIAGNLVVHGTIADQNGIVIPAGAVLPFYGTDAMIPPGWLLCDGQPIPTGSTYDTLRMMCGVNTPDLRGVFLRGIDFSTQQGRRGLDPDRTNEQMVPGSYQVDALQNHHHTYTHYNRPDDDEVESGDGDDVSDDEDDYSTRNTSQVIGARVSSSETHPKNVTVNFIIKY